VLRLAASDPTTTFTNVGLVVTFLTSVVYAENFHGGFIQWHMVVIYIYGTVFVTSQFYVIFMFPNQRFGEVCRHNRHILLHALPLFYVSLHWIQTLSAPS